MSAVAVLQTLLERVQKRSLEPRAPAPLAAMAVASVAAPGLQSASSVPLSSSPIPMAHRDRTITRQLQRVRADSVPLPPAVPLAVPDEDIEDYEDELIEIVDDGIVGEQAPVAVTMPASAPISSALQLDDPLENLSEPVVSAEPIEPGSAVPLTVAPERVARAAVTPGAVAVVQGQRLPLESTSFVDLLDVSLRLGA